MSAASATRRSRGGRGRPRQEGRGEREDGAVSFSAGGSPTPRLPTQHLTRPSPPRPEGRGKPNWNKKGGGAQPGPRRRPPRQAPAPLWPAEPVSPCGACKEPETAHPRPVPPVTSPSGAAGSVDLVQSRLYPTDQVAGAMTPFEYYVTEVAPDSAVANHSPVPSKFVLRSQSTAGHSPRRCPASHAARAAAAAAARAAVAAGVDVLICNEDCCCCCCHRCRRAAAAAAGRPPIWDLWSLVASGLLI